MHKRRYFLLTALFYGLCLWNGNAQNLSRNDEQFFYHIKKAKSSIIIDGLDNDAAWQGVQVASDFKQSFPYDTSLALRQSFVRLCFDEKNLYVFARCVQPNDFVVPSLKRDFPVNSADVITLLLDPFRDKLNGFYFAVNPYAIQKEGLLFNGNDLNVDWDNKWYTASSIDSMEYRVEIAIPFKTLRYKLAPDGKNEWNMNFIRNNLKENERSAWAAIPRNFRMIDINFAGRLIWDDEPPPPGINISLIPFGTVQYNEDNLVNTINREAQTGFDAKIAITPALNLDLTVNPDFAQVEVDRQVTNLSRFELFFPERRQFFLENNDLFGSFGYDNINPFFSRRIGLGQNVNNGQNVRVPIIAGARLSGRIDKNWRVGFLNMQTAKSESFQLPSTNFTVAAVQRRIGLRNNLGFIFVNRDEFNNDSSDTRFNRVAGLDYNLANSDGRWQGKAFIHKTFTPQDTSGQYAMAANINYNTVHFNFSNSIENVGTNYQAATGFVPRNGYLRNEANYAFVFFPKGRVSKTINSFSLSPDYDLFYGKNEKRITDFDAGLFYRVALQNGGEVNGALIRYDYTYLFFPFDPTNTGGAELPTSTSYGYLSTRLNMRSNPRKNFYFNINSRIGEYFNGNIVQLQSTFNLRIIPFATISADVNYTRIKLPAPYNSSTLWLIGPRAEITFTKNLFLNSFLQYNNQVNNFNINTRLQWRFKPASDFFLVYTDNYFATEDPETMVNNRGVKAFQNKNRALVAKLTYWFNL